MTEVVNTKGLENHEIKERFLQSKIAKETYKCQHKGFFVMKSELQMMITILSNLKKYNLETPIAHVVKRYPDFTTFGDACLEVGGSFSEKLFWWHTEYPEKVKALTLNNIRVIRKHLLSKELVSI